MPSPRYAPNEQMRPQRHGYASYGEAVRSAVEMRRRSLSSQQSISASEGPSSEAQQLLSSSTHAQLTPQRRSLPPLRQAGGVDDKGSSEGNKMPSPQARPTVTAASASGAAIFTEKATRSPFTSCDLSPSSPPPLVGNSNARRHQLAPLPTHSPASSPSSSVVGLKKSKERNTLKSSALSSQSPTVKSKYTAHVADPATSLQRLRNVTAIRSRPAPAMDTVAGSSPNFSAEVGDKLSASLVALRQWAMRHHPAASLRFAKKIDRYCEDAMAKCGYGGGGGNKAPQQVMRMNTTKRGGIRRDPEQQWCLRRGGKAVVVDKKRRSRSSERQRVDICVALCRH